MITGTWAPTPPTRTGWPTRWCSTGSEAGGSFTVVGPLVADVADVTGAAGRRPPTGRTLARRPVHRGLPRRDCRRGLGRGRRPPGADQREPSRDEPGDGHHRGCRRSSRLSTGPSSSPRPGILLLLVQFGVLAGYAIILVAALLMERRATETALLRARGAGLGHLARMATLEAIVIVVPAVIFAPWLATLLVAAVGLNPALAGVGLEAPLPGPTTFGVAAGVGLLAVLALTLPTLASGVSIAGVRASVGRQVGRTLPQRLGLDLALVALAVIALLPAPAVRGAADPERARVAGRGPAARRRPGHRPPRAARCSRSGSSPASPSSRSASSAAASGLVPAARRAAGRPPAAALHPGRAPPDARRGARDLRVGPRRDVDARARPTRRRSRPARTPAGSPPDRPATSRTGRWARRCVALPGVEGATPVVEGGASPGHGTFRDATLLASTARRSPTSSGCARTRRATPRVASLRALGANRDPTRQGRVPLPDGTRRALGPASTRRSRRVDGFAPVPAGLRGDDATSALILDGDGRLARFEGSAVPTGEAGSRSVIPLTGPDGRGAARGPAAPDRARRRRDPRSPRIRTRSAAAPSPSMASRPAPTTTGDTWTPTTLDRRRLDWSWTRSGNRQPLGSVPSRPYTRPASSTPEPPGPRGRDWSLPRRPPPPRAGRRQRGVPRQVRGRDRRHARRVRVRGPGQAATCSGSSTGSRRRSRPSRSCVADGASLELARLAGGRDRSAPTGEWWIATDPGARRLDRRAGRGPRRSTRQAVVDRSAVTAGLVGDPLGLGGHRDPRARLDRRARVRVDRVPRRRPRSRRGAARRVRAAQGAGRRAAPAPDLWLTAEGAALLFVGLLPGVGLGLLLAWLALPFATLTASGEPPVPRRWSSSRRTRLVPTLILAVALLLATVVLVGRLLPAAQTSAVLRARDE